MIRTIYEGKSAIYRLLASFMRQAVTNLLWRRKQLVTESSFTSLTESLIGTRFALSKLPPEARIVEVGPRDGLQNEETKISTESKIKFIDLLTHAGLQAVETTSFVSPKRVPQLSDAAEVVQGIHRAHGVRYAVLVPNMKGLDRAIESGAPEVAVFIAATETFSRKNIGCSIADSLTRYQEVIQKAHDVKLPVRGYISVIAGCPYEGNVDAGGVAELAMKLSDMGCYEVSLGDTTGVATPSSTLNVLQACKAQGLPVSQTAVHMHDTYGQAVANIFAALQMGVSVIDSSVAGLGGCPFSPGATGNVATEDIIFLLDGLGIKHGVDTDKLSVASTFILKELGKQTNSRASRAVQAQRKRNEQP